MTHAEAIAALILADNAIRTEKGRTPRPWYLSNLHTALSRTERRGFAHGELVRDTMKRRVVGFGHAFPPSKRLTPAIRIEIVELVKSGGLEVELVKGAGVGSSYAITVC